MAYRIDLSVCINCSLCRRSCPTETISYFSTGQRTHIIHPAGCIDCDICAQVCPVDCIDKDPEYVHELTELEAAREKARQWAKKRRQGQITVREAARAAIARVQH